MLPTSLSTWLGRLRPLLVGLVLLFGTPGASTLVEEVLFAMTGNACCTDDACDENPASGHCPRCHAHGGLFVDAEPSAGFLGIVHETEPSRDPVFGLRTHALTSLEHRDAPYRPPAS